MNVVIFGDETTIPRMLDELRGQVSAAVVASNRPRAFEILKRTHGAELLVQPSIHSEDFPIFLEKLKAMRPAWFFCFSYSMVLSKALLSIPNGGAINFHGGILPEYRGANICNWVLIEDAGETGMSAHHMSLRIDEGDIIAVERIPINDRDTALSVKERTDVLGYGLLRNIWSAVREGKSLPRIPQDRTRARYYRRRTPEDSKIDWKMTDREIFNVIRASVKPWPGAFFHTKCGERVVLDCYHNLGEIAELREKYA